MKTNADINNELFDWTGGNAHYRGLRVHHETVMVADRTFRIAGLADAADLLDHEDFARHFIEDDRAPYGMELWPAAPMMAEFILNGEDGAGRPAIEIGCGLALVSMAAAIKGWNIVAVDHEPTSLEFARYNAAINRVAVPVFETMNWHKPSSDGRFDRIFGADILYQLVDHVPILKCIDALLGEDAVGLIADPNRGVADRFADLAQEHGFHVELLPTSFDFRRRGLIRGRIFRLTRATPR
jgi:predicted nicotinamide N-methyase